MKRDVIVLNEGNIFIFNPQTKRAKTWVAENVHLESWQKWAGNSFVVDHHYADQIAQGMKEAGLKLM